MSTIGSHFDAIFQGRQGPNASPTESTHNSGWNDTNACHPSSVSPQEIIPSSEDEHDTVFSSPIRRKSVITRSCVAKKSVAGRNTCDTEEGFARLSSFSTSAHVCASEGGDTGRRAHDDLVEVASPPPDSTNPFSAPSSTQMSATQTDSQYSQLARLPSTPGTMRRVPRDAYSQVSATQTDSQYSQLALGVLVLSPVTTAETQMSATQTDSQYSQMVREVGGPMGRRTGDDDGKVQSEIKPVAARVGNTDRASSVTLPDDDDEDALRLHEDFTTPLPASHCPPSTILSTPSCSPRSLTLNISSSPSTSQTQNSMPAFASQDDASIETSQGTVTPRRLRQIMRAYRNRGDVLAAEDADAARQFFDIFDETQSEDGSTREK